jgi:protease IV
LVHALSPNAFEVGGITLKCVMTSPLQIVPSLAYNAGAAVRNTLAALPGKRPEVVVVELTGSFPARATKRKLLSVPPQLGPRELTLEELQGQLTGLAEAPWLKGVLFRAEGLQLDLTTAGALRRQLEALKGAGKRLSIYLTRLDLVGYYLASAAHEIILPESAELSVFGLAFKFTFMRDALARYGVAFEKLAIREFKNAGDTLVRQEMSEAQRTQYGRLLESLEETLLDAIAVSRNTTPRVIRSWFDEGVTSAARAQALGMIDRVAYEDEIIGDKHKPQRGATRFVRTPLRPLRSKRVAVITLEGAIVTGKSRKSPFPLPLLGRVQAGSETLLRAFRTAEADKSTAAIVLYVDSGGGSALASDLIWREVVRIKRSKPVVAVMGGVAASGGYYVLTHADQVIAAPTTLTGSIGVLTGKFVLEGFNTLYGFHPEALSRGRFALSTTAARPFSEDERTLQERLVAEVYERFTNRVAAGRGLSQAQVDELGRGRVWTGRDAHALGLVDELGDLELGVARAKEIAGLHRQAPVWNVSAPAKLLLPTEADPTTLLRVLAQLQQERVLLLAPLPSVRG